MAKPEAPKIDFSKFLALASDPENRARAIAGFAERQKAREVRFQQEAEQRAPGPDFYDRRYDI